MNVRLMEVSGWAKTLAFLKEAWLPWEKLRIYYNLILLGEGLVGVWFLRWLAVEVGHRCANLFGPSLWINIGVVGILANAMFCLGPLSEVFLGLVREQWRGRVRPALFAAGLVVSIGVVGLAILRGYVHVSGFAQ